MKNQVDRWNNMYKQLSNKPPKYNNWLEKYKIKLKISKEIPIIDLGCGYGNDTLYLYERGYEVISCDFSEEALKIIKRLVPNPDTRQFNILDGLPFADNSAKIIIYDLSIHYFNWEDTKRVINDIFRVLAKNGYLLCRVNSVKDFNHGAGQGKLIENNFYDINGKMKRLKR